ncbi:hypothetical protein B0H16DRAFT_1759602 [Mycena metata]|uniref:Uncharacterized protein n=1 Tax=Mycena metata TaxID=1033252 RepID=A0AAD7JYP5_9AGAR|nr:hypothetical protein B0H16DRAFT_1759602 [Mycena metata]
MFPTEFLSSSPPRSFAPSSSQPRICSAKSPQTLPPIASSAFPQRWLGSLNLEGFAAEESVALRRQLAGSRQGFESRIGEFSRGGPSPERGLRQRRGDGAKRFEVGDDGGLGVARSSPPAAVVITACGDWSGSVSTSSRIQGLNPAVDEQPRLGHLAAYAFTRGRERMWMHRNAYAFGTPNAYGGDSVRFLCSARRKSKRHKLAFHFSKTERLDVHVTALGLITSLSLNAFSREFWSAELSVDYADLHKPPKCSNFATSEAEWGKETLTEVGVPYRVSPFAAFKFTSDGEPSTNARITWIKAGATRGVSRFAVQRPQMLNTCSNALQHVQKYVARADGQPPQILDR